MKYILTIEADVKPDEIIGLKEQIAEVIPDARVVEVSEVNNGDTKRDFPRMD